MERGSLGTSLHGSALASLLARLALVEAPTARPSFVDGLGRWLGWTDAIALAGALHAPAAERPAAASHAAAATLAGDLARVHAALARAIEGEDEDNDAGHARRRGPPGSRRPPPPDTDFAACRRRYVDLQRAMDADIGPLRARARAAVAQRSPEGARLAAIDAVLERVVGARQQMVLSTLPALLETHFKRLRRADGDAAWPGAFRHDMQRLLLAELELRLQPVHGLLEALRTP